MYISKIKKISLLLLEIFLITVIILCININNQKKVLANDDDDKMQTYIENIFSTKSKAVLNKDLDYLKSIYDTKNKLGQWAYEYEEKKVQYINNWAEKQGIKFVDIIPNILITKSKIKDDISYFNVLCNTEYKYTYADQPEIINSSRIGTHHCLKLNNDNGNWIITKEWYTDPFADSLNLENIKADVIKQYIALQPARDFSNISERRKNAVEYAEKYCGISNTNEEKFKYNRKYKNFNSEGGDCANFASQILHEGGKFKKNSTWNYSNGGASSSWVNADNFTHYMLNSGRASVIASGSYEKVYKASYKLIPGDFVAYEKNGNITHISVVTGADSKGYSLVTCHNTDRNNVPWDLGWSDKKMKFWLVRMHY